MAHYIRVYVRVGLTNELLARGNVGKQRIRHLCSDFHIALTVLVT